MSLAPYDTSRNSAAQYDTHTPWKSATVRTPCAICGAKKYCEYKDDGTIHCMSGDAAREPGARPCNSRNGGYIITPAREQARSPRVLPLLPTKKPRAAVPTSATARGVREADVETKHAVYTSLLELCPLLASHGTLLTGPDHSLTADQARRYGTLPGDSRDKCATLAQRHGRDALLSVPGFVEKDGRIVARGAGIILPTRDAQGRIVAIDVRREQPKPGEAKYFKLSSGTVGGASSGTPAHVARPAELRNDRTVYVTEGVKKADVAADALGCVVIGVVGHSTWDRARPILDELAEAGAVECVIALDRDAKPETAAAVDRSRQQLAADAVALGYAVRIAEWDGAAAKGLDDVLQAGITPLRTRYKPVQGVQGDGDGEDTLATLKAQYEALQKREADVTRLLNSALRPTDKMLTYAVWNITGQYPSTCNTLDAPLPLVRVDRGYIASQAGVSVATVSKGLPDLADLGIIRREMRFTPETGGQLWVGAGQFRERPWTTAEVQTPARAKDRARKVCPKCGSTHLAAIAYICEDCNTECSVAEAESAGLDAAAAAVTAEATAETEAGPTTITTLDGRLVDAETGEILGGTEPFADVQGRVGLDSEVSTVDAVSRGTDVGAAEPVSDVSGATFDAAYKSASDAIAAVADALLSSDEVWPRIDPAWERYDWPAFVQALHEWCALYGVSPETAGLPTIPTPEQIALFRELPPVASKPRDWDAERQVG